jgi:hypothetical protein
MLQASRFLQAGAMLGKRPWEGILRRTLKSARTERPADLTDKLSSTLDPSVEVPHPFDPERRPGQPRVFLGPVASGNTLLKNPVKRDALRDRFGIKALEMEGAGIADATWTLSAEYLVVRGVSDYGDEKKGDLWRTYACLAAVAYTRALIESMPCRAVQQHDSGLTSRVSGSWVKRLGTLAGCLLVGLLCLGYWSDGPTYIRKQPYLSVLGGIPQRPSFQIYIQSETLPVKLYIDGQYWRTLEEASPGASVSLAPGKHMLVATKGNFRFERLVSLAGSTDRLLVLIPRS